VEAEQDRVERGVQQENREQDRRRQQKKDRGDVVRTLWPARARGCETRPCGQVAGRDDWRWRESHLSPFVAEREGGLPTRSVDSEERRVGVEDSTRRRQCR